MKTFIMSGLVVALEDNFLENFKETINNANIEIITGDDDFMEIHHLDGDDFKGTVNGIECYAYYSGTTDCPEIVFDTEDQNHRIRLLCTLDGIPEEVKRIVFYNTEDD